MGMSSLGCLPWRRARSSTRPTLASPKIDPGNSLRHPLREIGDKDRVDAILTNPPFGGEEERGIQNNFPIDKQTSETALLFLQLIMRKLRRQEVVRVVTPEVGVDGLLFVYASRRNSATISMVITSESESFGAGPRLRMGSWELKADRL